MGRHASLVRSSMQSEREIGFNHVSSIRRGDPTRDRNLKPTASTKAASSHPRDDLTDVGKQRWRRDRRAAVRGLNGRAVILVHVPGAGRDEPRVGWQRVAAASRPRPVPILLYGVSRGRANARSFEQEGPTIAAQDGRHVSPGLSTIWHLCTQEAQL